MSGDPGGPRGLDSLDWKSFWDLASPQRAAVVIAELYGAEAASKAMECATAAHDDGREDDRRFWVAVYARLRAAGSRAAGGRPAPAPN